MIALIRNIWLFQWEDTRGLKKKERKKKQQQNTEGKVSTKSEFARHLSDERETREQSKLVFSHRPWLFNGPPPILQNTW